VRDEKIDFLLAVGGGAVVDGAKFVAAAALFEGDEWNILLQGGNRVEKALPFGAVVTRRSLKTKLLFHSQHVFPKFSILDPTKTFTLPSRQVANGVG
jgi:NADP-dependent alcohol dehydrogenase